MFEELADFPWEQCRSRYDQVRQIVNAATDELTQRDLIFQVLWSHGGRCDCTVGHSIVDRPEVFAETSAEIAALLAAEPPVAVEPLLKRKGWQPSIQPMGRAHRVGEHFEYESAGGAGAGEDS